MEKDKKVKEFMKTFVEHGMGCGDKISAILQKRHPNAKVYPLYRSAVAIEYDEKERKIYLFTSDDPHAMGQELTDKTVTEVTFLISGNRFGPDFYHIIGDRALLMKTTF